MIEIRTQYSATRMALEVFVIRRDFGGNRMTEALQPEKSVGGNTLGGSYHWQEVQTGSMFSPTFILHQDLVHKLVEDLNRDNMGVKEGAETTVEAHKDDLKEILDKVLPHALREVR